VPGLNEAVILTPNVVSLLKEVAQYDVISEPAAQVDVATDSVQAAQATVQADMNINDRDENMTSEQANVYDIENPDGDQDERAADMHKLADEQLKCPELKPYFEMAKHDKNKFYIKDGLL